MSKQKKSFSGWNLLWLIPLAILTAIGVMMYAVPAFERVNGAQVEGSASWMQALPDETPLSQVVLPGTHDSATEFVQLAYFSKCQALSIRGQLDAGFRYLDIRLDDSEEMALMHGFTHCTVSGWPWAKPLLLESVLSDCYAFLRENPSETVLFCVKHEHGDETDAVFAERLSKLIEAESGLWYAGEGIPTVGEARGKLVLLKRFEDDGKLPGLTFNWSDQGGYDDPVKNTEANGNPALTLWVQDRYEYEADEKWAAFTGGMAASETSADAVSLNFLSTKGHAKYGHPYKYAPGLNEKLGAAGALNGWIIVDFGSAELAKTIYDINFR